jgi:hypothetical protein
MDSRNISAIQATTEALSYAVVNDKSGVVKLLERNNISMPKNPSDKEVNIAVLHSLKNSNFKKELSRFLGEKVKEYHDDYGHVHEGFGEFVASNEDFGFTGLDDFQMWTGNPLKVEGFKNVVGVGSPTVSQSTISSVKSSAVYNPSSTSKGSGKGGFGRALAGIGTWLKDNVLTQDNINSGIQLGLTNLQNKAQSKTNEVQNQAILLQQQQDMLKAQQAANEAKGGLSSTTKYILIGVGVLVVGGIIYAVSRKK